MDLWWSVECGANPNRDMMRFMTVFVLVLVLGCFLLHILKSTRLGLAKEIHSWNSDPCGELYHERSTLLKTAPAAGRSDHPRSCLVAAQLPLQLSASLRPQGLRGKKPAQKRVQYYLETPRQTQLDPNKSFWDYWNIRRANTWVVFLRSMVRRPALGIILREQLHS